MPSSLAALSPLDGRYYQKVTALGPFFSEQALLFFRTKVEVEWLKMLSTRKDIPEVRAFSAEEMSVLNSIEENFSEKSAERIKEIESETNHDVKAVEYFLKENLQETSLSDMVEWIHFGCTSEDINNTAYALMLQQGITNVLLPAVHNIQAVLSQKSAEWKAVPLLARTHGQTASPTTMGKAWLNFAARLQRQLHILSAQEYLGKWNGATGNFNAHNCAYPEADWLDISKHFVESLGLTWQPVSDQIEPHDFIAEISHTFVRMNTILVHFARDIWGYISLGYFSQQVKKGEVGSSTMPHKVNPIDFENAEGNLGLANALFEFFAAKLPITRWQRDLTDSTVLRNLGTAFGHTLLALQSLAKGIGKLQICEEAMRADLQKNPEVLAEAVQTVMRKHGIANPYEKLKALTRGKRLEMKEYQQFVESLKIPQEAKEQLRELTPATYTGLATKIVDDFLATNT